MAYSETPISGDLFENECQEVLQAVKTARLSLLCGQRAQGYGGCHQESLPVNGLGPYIGEKHVILIRKFT